MFFHKLFYIKIRQAKYPHNYINQSILFQRSQYICEPIMKKLIPHILLYKHWTISASRPPIHRKRLSHLPWA